MITVDVPIRDPKKPPKLVFPDRCVNCGKPKAKTFSITLNTGAQARGQMVQLAMDVPLCADCLAKENKIGNLTWIPFFVVGLLACGIVFVPVMLLSPEGTTAQTMNMPYVLGAAAGLFAGMIVGTLVEAGLKLLFAPVYGRLLLRRPLTVVSVLSDAENLIGFATRFADGRKTLKLTFENEDMAREFAALNPQEKS